MAGFLFVCGCVFVVGCVCVCVVHTQINGTVWISVLFQHHPAANEAHLLSLYISHTF